MSDTQSIIQKTDGEESVILRNHKHDYAKLFQKVVSKPARTIIKEFIKHPDFFTEEERKEILQIYTDAIELRGKYDMLGKNVDDQIFEIERSFIPQIRNLNTFYNKVYALNRKDKNGNDIEPENSYFFPHLFKAIQSHSKLCDLMTDMHNAGYGKKSSFFLMDLINKAFYEDIAEYESIGISTYHYKFYGRELSDVKVCLDADGFKIHVLDNLINNFHKYAFNDIFEESLIESTFNYSHENIGNLDVSVSFLLGSVTERLLNMWNPKHNNVETIDTSNVPKDEDREKLVRMELQKDENDNHRINVIIKNNGEKFIGDTQSVFSYGNGRGTGIGLASARSFIEYHGGTIKMETYDYDNDIFTVGFIINLPII